MDHLLGPFAYEVTQVLEYLIVAGAWLGEGGKRASIGHETHPLFLHQLALPLFGLRELSGNDNQAQVDHKE